MSGEPTNVKPVELTREQARRIAVRAQLLDAQRPTDLLEVFRRLTLVQVDLTAAVAPSADIVCWSRLGSQGYQPHDLDQLFEQGSVIEYQLRLRPAEDIPLYRAEMDRWPGPEPLNDWEIGLIEWVDANEECRTDILELLRSEGPLPGRELPDTCVVPWRSSGWNNNRNVTMLLELMERRGEIAVAGREGRERLWDLAVRVHPDLSAVPAEEAATERERRRLAALGIARSKGPATPVERDDVGTQGALAVVEGVRGRWRVDADQLQALDEPFEGRTALLSPLDRLVYDRKRLAELFEFDYQLEMYKPAAKRRWGYWALPILHGDQFVGKADLTSDLDRGVLRVNAIHEDEPFTRQTRAAVDGELEDLAACLDLTLDRTTRHLKG
jgi:uncharacterized protein YcaQ